MEEKRKNYSLAISHNGDGKSSIFYREAHEGGEFFNKPTDSRGRELLDFIRRFSANNPNSRLSLEAKNYI